jgi:hypothetical protein
MVMNKSKQAAVALCVLSCLIVVCPTRAGEFRGVKDGYYLGAMFVYNQMSGDFDDRLIFESTDEADLNLFNVPDVDNGAGFGLYFGRRLDRFSFEIGYQATFHDTSTVIPEIGNADGIYNVVDLNIKIDLFTQSRLRPYLLIGGGIPWLTIENSKSPDDGVTWNKDVRYVGACLNAGVGVAYYFNPQWALTAGLIHRWNWFTHGESASLIGGLEERTLGLTTGLAYTF